MGSGLVPVLTHYSEMHAVRVFKVSLGLAFAVASAWKPFSSLFLGLIRSFFQIGVTSSMKSSLIPFLPLIGLRAPSLCCRALLDTLHWPHSVDTVPLSVSSSWGAT